MKKQHYQGSVLSQYGIVIALIALALIPVFFLLGKNLVSYFDSLYKGLASQKTGITSNTPSSGSSNNSQSAVFLEAGSLGGTPDKPVKQCQNGVCDIDFGEYVLTGMPQDINDYIQSAGSSGATDMLAGLIEQLANQLEKNGDTEEANSLRDLANLQHYMADIQKIVEDAAKTCDSNYSSLSISNKEVFSSSCFKSNIAAKTMPPIPDSIKGMLNLSINPGEPLTPETFAYISKQLIDFGDIGKARYDKINSPDSFNIASKSVPSYAAINVLDNIIAGDKYSTNLKGSTVAILNNINILGARMDATIKGITQSSGFDTKTFSSLGISPPDTTKTIRDVLTGQEVASYDYSNSKVEDIYKAQTSLQTQYYAGVICESGYNKDNGYQCN